VKASEVESETTVSDLTREGGVGQTKSEGVQGEVTEDKSGVIHLQKKERGVLKRKIKTVGLNEELEGGFAGEVKDPNGAGFSLERAPGKS